MTYASPITPVAKSIHLIDSSGYYTATDVEDALKEIQERRFQVLKEPTGFENRTDSDLYSVQPSYAAGPDELTVTLTHVSDFSVFVGALEIIKTATDTVVISAPAEGVYWIYYDSAGTLTASITPFDFSDTTKAPVAVLYWDDTNNRVVYLGDERHGTVMDSETHVLLHDTVGTRYESGLTISGYTLSTDSNAAVSIGVAEGKLHDEDIVVSIVDDATPDTYWEQDLTDPAQIPIFYRDGAAGDWRKIAATDYPFHPTGSGRLAYDNIGVGLAEGTNNYYIAYWIFATNDINNPIISIMGQRQDLKLVDAKANNTYESFAFGTLPFQEMKVLYRIILQTKTVNTNAIKSTIEDVADYRALSTVATGTYVANSHSLLSDLSNDDHTQYLLADGTRALTGDWAVGAHAISGITTLGMTGQLTNTLAIGTPPFVITSTTVVPNLNVDQVDGYDLDQAVLIASTPTFGGLTINGAMLLNGAITGVNSIACDLGTSINEFSVDGTLVGDSDDALPTEKAVKTYVDTQVATVNSLAEILALGNEADGTDLILDEGADLIVYSDDKVTEKARIDGATGNITTAGTVDGVDVAALKTDVDGFNDELKDLTQVEIQQLELIDAVTISGAQWGYLGALDQSLIQAASPTFVGLTLSADLVTTSTIDGVDVAGLKTDVDGFNDELKDLTQVEIQQLENIDASLISVGEWTQLAGISNTHVGLTGGQGLDTPSTEADWSNLGWLYSAMIHISVGIDEGAPVDNYGYFLKVAQRDSAGGWGGLWVGYSADQNYFGRTATSGAYATWEKIAIHGTSLAFADVTVDSLITVGTVDGVDVSTLPALIAANTTVAEVENIIIAELVNGESIDLAIDALILTHKNIAAAHHAKWTTGDTEGVITAELVNGQSIDLAIDALILTHKNIAAAHHAKWTTGDTEGVITAELVNGQSIDLAIDALINTHNAADTHIAHSGVTITAGVGLSGGGTIAANRTIDCDITQYTNAMAIAAVVAEDPLTLTHGLTIAGALAGVTTLNMSGNLTVGGTVDGVDIALLKTDVDGFNDELKDLTQVEIQQLENIDATTISIAQWGYLGALDQGLTQASSPTFVGLTLSGAIATATNVSMTGELDLTGVGASIDINPAKTTTHQIINITPTAAIIAANVATAIHLDATAWSPAGAGSILYGLNFIFDGVNFANSPSVYGVRIVLPADYLGASAQAAYFSGDGRIVQICGTTYALNVAGAMRFDGVITGVNSIACDLGTSINEFSIDDTLAGDSDDAVPTEQAVKAYADVIQADVDGFQDELKDLTQVEIQQLENIDATTISVAQWGYLGALDQALTQASSPTFVGLTLSGAITGVTTFSAGTATFEVAADGYITTYPGMVIGADNYVLTYDHALGTLVLEIAGGGGASLAATLAIGNETDGANIIIDSSGDLIVYSDDKVTEKARIDGATGDITTAGTVDSVDVSAHAADSSAHHSVIDYWEMNLIEHTGTISTATGLAGVALATDDIANFGLVIPRTGTISIYLVAATDANINAFVNTSMYYNLGSPKYAYAGVWDGTKTGNINLSTATNYYSFSRFTNIEVTAGHYLSVMFKSTEVAWTTHVVGVFIKYTA